MKIRLLWLLLVLIALPSHAQDADPSDYRLRVPSAEAYLRAVPIIVEQTREEHPSKDIYNDSVRAIVELLKTEFHERFPDLRAVSVSFETLYGAYLALEPVTITGYYALDDWPQLLVMTWLRENSIDLDQVEQIEFGDYVIDVTPVDFNGDGLNEWILEIDSDLYDGIWIIQNVDNQYIRIPAGYFNYGAYCPIQLGCGGVGYVVASDDINADGLPELQVIHGGCGYGICGFSLFIFGWRDGEFVSLTDITPSRGAVSGGGGIAALPFEGIWTLEDIDDDPPLELLQDSSVTDNRDCAITINRVFDWDEDRDLYIAGEETYQYADSAGCALRLAHIAMIELDFDSAIQHYEHAIELSPVDGTDYERESRQYAQVRLAAAYALAGNEDEAVQILTEVSNLTPESPVVENLINSATNAYLETHNPVAFCTAMYNSINMVNPFTSRLEELYILDYGQINDYGIPQTYGGGDFSGDNTGCNLRSLLEQAAMGLSIHNNIPPTQALVSFGWELIEQYNVDLNNDGMGDWLLWFSNLSDFALVLISDGSHYIVTTGRLPLPGSHYTGTPTPPDFIGAPLNANIQYATVAPATDVTLLAVVSETPVEQPDCPSGIREGRIVFLYWNGTRLTSIEGNRPFQYSYTLCMMRPLEELLPTPTTLRAWVGEPVAVETTLTWDSETMTYVAPDIAQPTPEPTVVASIDDYFNCGFDAEFFCGFSAQGEEALVMIDAVLASPPDTVDSFFLTHVHYRRALALEALGRADEALAEYVAIYEAAPDSAWGMLAGLHIERVE